MKVKSFKRAIGSSLAVAVTLGTLAACPAQAGSGLIKNTHSATAYKWVTQPVHPAVPKAYVKVNQGQPEIQVAVMAKSPAQPGARRSVYIHR
ncbi:MAG TPA: hypothetical protein VGR14_15275 [Verrucomicrobiae bacterium]|jgi:hypothetical protein|nr:hypothetical protein [Verrucomicrobiae bacterium]